MRRLLSVLGACLYAAAAAAQGPAPPQPAAPDGAGSLRFQRGDTVLSVQCPPGETMQACAEAASALMGKLGGLGPDQAEVARPVSSGGPEIVPELWMRASPSLDPTHLPLGDHKMTTDAPQKGAVFACDPFMYSMTRIIGATRIGPWIDQANGTYDVTRKLFDRGRVEWAGRFAATARGDERIIEGNGLPLPGVPTGIFPVPATDPAYQYDRNPNPMTEQAIRFTIPLHPQFGPAPRCVYKEVGITLDGIQIHTGLDSSGRDENAYELNDTCSGKPQPGGGYHRSTLSACQPHVTEPGVVLGYALDGFAITGPYEASGAELTSKDLDECHGTTSEIVWDGRKAAMYHYVFTRDFPYSVACFKGTPTRNAFPPLPGAPPQLR